MTQVHGTAEVDGSTLVVFTVPADHKYEVLSISLSQNSNAINRFRILYKPASGSSWDLMREETTAATYARIYDFSALCFLPTDQLHLNCTDTVGAATWSWFVTYMDVDLTP